MKNLVLIPVFLLAFAACQPKTEGDQTTERTEAEAATHPDSLSHDSMPADNTQVLDTTNRSSKAE